MKAPAERLPRGGALVEEPRRLPARTGGGRGGERKPDRGFDTDADAVERLDRTWRDRGFVGWLTSVDHKSIGKRYIATAFVFFALAGVLALLMRTQLARPESGLLDPDRYNQLFTVHGTTMMFLFAVPVMQAMGLYFVPLMVGTRNVAFPRLNALGYWTYLIGGGLLYASLLAYTGPDTGWFSYVPLAGPTFGPGKRADVWAQSVTFTATSTRSIV